MDDLTAIVFPGQGSQTEGMGDLVAETRPDLLEVARDAVGEDPFAAVGTGSRFDQPAILCASLAAWSALGRPRGAAFAGHSLGEITALAAAGALREDAAVRLVALRGRLMDEAAAGRPGGMLALLGAEPEQAAELAEAHGLAVANDNGAGQTVLAGDGDRVDAAVAAAGERGLRAKRLPVAGAFHSPAMAPARAPFAAALADVELVEPAVPVLSCVTAAPFCDPRAQLAAALTSPVRWREVVLALHERGIRRFLEPGPGKVLSGLVRRTVRDATVEAPGPKLEAAHA
jgi:malonyl CoA-acyl carrier protein transacylase